MLSFKGVGTRTFEVSRVNTIETSLTPIGFKTPIEYGIDGSGFFKMHYLVADQLEDNLRNLLQTNFGDRVSNFHYGANLQPLTTEYTSKDDFDQEAMVRINTAVSTWMPFVELVGFDSNPRFDSATHTGKIEIIIKYSIPRVQVFNKQMRITLFVI